MKKSNLFFAMAAGAMLVSSCASEQEMPNSPVNNGEGKQVIVLSVNNQDGTRAGRPLLSSEAAQNIENVKVIITDCQNTVVWMYDYTKWNDGQGTEYANGLQATLTIDKDEYNFVEKAEALKNSLIEAGNTDLAEKASEYKVYALGWSNGTDYNLSAVETLEVGKTFNEDLTIAYTNDSSKGNRAEEIFAGDQTFEAANTIKANVVLNRQVAGTFGYLREIPYIVKDGKVGQYLHLIASDYNSHLVLGQFANNDHANGEVVKYVVNGVKNKISNEDKIVYTINLNDWFTKLEGLELEDETVIVDYANWKNPTDATDEPIHYRKGSVFGASFIHPFAKAEANTFTLVLSTDEECTDALQEWTVVLTDDSQIKPHTVWSYNYNKDNVGAWVSEGNVADTYTRYSILRNNLYSIGARPKAEPKDPNDPKDPDPEPDPDPNDPDDPTPLNNKQQLVIKVNSNWEVMHQMGLM
ncbi:MAG: hypothetical protein K2M88_02260 [Muribaculaceae bacterium]|nr:hypothetical protein [Muribaculaceae bacterium]